MKILLIGAAGMVGSALLRRRAPGEEWLTATRREADLADGAAVERLLRERRPDLVCNAAAFLGVDPCAREPERAAAVNFLGPWHLARACARLGAGLVHFSTDAVFDGGKDGPYTEEDAPRPINVYGMTKHLGDLAVAANSRRCWIMRVPLLFGTRENRGGSFPEKMLQLVQGGKTELWVADDVVSSPSSSDDIAAETLRLVRDGAAPGLYHLRNRGEASLFDLTEALLARLGRTVQLHRAKAADFAPRELDNKPLRTPLGSVKLEPLRPWQEALDDYVAALRARGEA